MTMLRLKPLMAVVLVLSCAVLLMALVSPVAAQPEACVHLQVGSGYAATMQVNFEGGVIGPSGSFAIGQTQCLPLSALGDGIPFSVQVNAILGENVICNPPSIPHSTAFPVAITFNASGTTLNVHCDAPTGATLPEPTPTQ
jgi:hypothetical protein